MTDLERTLAFIAHRQLAVVLCRPRSKQPAVDAAGHWRVSADTEEVRMHVDGGGNLGLIAGRTPNLVLFDPDNVDEWARLVRVLRAPGKAWVRTGSGKLHYYVRWEAGLPAKLRPLFGGEPIGEIMRGGADGLGQQHCVIPPSLHPVTGEPYVWLVDPATEPIEPLPESWRLFFGPDPPWLQPRAGSARPDPARRDRRVRLDGLTPHPVLEALLPPGWSRRSSGALKFACPQCRADGHDHHGDNAILFADGRFGCAWAGQHPVEGPRHRRAIARLLAGETT